MLDIANGCAATGIQCENSFVTEFGRKVSFRQLYELIKFNKLYIYNQNIPHATCLCDIYENAVSFMQGLNQSAPKEVNLPSNPDDVVDKYLCNSNRTDCMNSKCKECELPGKIAYSGAFETDNEYKQVGCRVQKGSISIDVKDVSHFNTHVKALKRHIHEKRIQHTKRDLGSS